MNTKQLKQILERMIPQIIGALITAAILTWTGPKPQPMSVSPIEVIPAILLGGVLITFVCWFILALIAIHAIKRFIEEDKRKRGW